MSQFQPEEGRSTVLVVEDDAAIAMSIRQMLEHSEFDVVEARDEESAIKRTRELKPHVALVDFRLAKKDGIEVCQSLRNIDGDLHVILMTAFPSLDLAMKAMRSGIYDFLAKPIDMTYLIQSIKNALEKRTLSIENRSLITSLTKSNAELDRLNSIKTKFLTIVTHDLRSPLTAVKGYAGIMKTVVDTGDQTVRECLSGIENSVDWMNGLIANLQDMGSIEAGKLRVELVPTDFAALCREIRGRFNSIARLRHVNLQWDVLEEHLIVLGDSERLAQVLSNLIGNALKYTPKDGKVEVRVLSNGKVVLAEILDSGEGLLPEEQSKIFELFYQVETSPSRKSGLGLGLAICKEIVASHDGRIGVESKGLGKGSRFWFEIPRLEEGSVS